MRLFNSCSDTQSWSMSNMRDDTIILSHPLILHIKHGICIPKDGSPTFELAGFLDLSFATTHTQCVYI